MSSKRNITYKCPYCDKRFNKENLVIHVGDKHDDMIPQGYSAFRVVFDYVNKKPAGYNGKCIICGNETGWDEAKGKYNRLCNNPECKKKYVKQFEDRMMKSKGVTRISSTADGQAKMLANRKISGEYKFQDGGIKTYTGTYEKKALEFMDKVMNIKSEDVTTPGPIMEYMFEGKKHIYISDIYYAPYNLIIEVKDGGDNPNNRSMPEYRAKQIAKEKWIIKNTDFNYLRLTNNDFSQLLAAFMELKMEMSNDTPERVIRINEGQYIEESNNELSFKSDKDLLEWMKKNIKYSNYTKLKSHDEVLKSKKGSCHDQVIFEYEELKKLGYSPRGLFVMERDKNNQGGTTHSLVYYKKGNKICWFEHAWEGQEGIGEHNSLSDIKNIIKDMYNNYGWGNLKKYGYLEFKTFSIASHKPGESLQQFIDKCFGESINEGYIEEISRSGIKSEFLEKGDSCYNLDKWPDQYNILFVTGISGSGKTTLGIDLAKEYNCGRVELDYIAVYYLRKCKERNAYDKFRSKLQNDCPEAVEFFDLNPPEKYGLREKWADTGDILTDFCNWFVTKFGNNGKPYIINGSYIYEIFDVNFFYDKPLIIKDINIVKTVFRRTWREFNDHSDASFFRKLEYGYKVFKTGLSKEYRKANKDFKLYRKDMNKNAELVESYIKEGFLKSEPDILYNKEAFDNGDINICFVIGLSGSGKTTFALSKANDRVDMYSLDDLWCTKDHFTMKELKDYGDLIYSYFSGPGKKFYITYDELQKQNILGLEYEDKLIPNFIDYAIKWAKNHKNKKYIIEGIWIISKDDNDKPYFDPSYFKDYAFYIKGTSIIKSRIRAAKRDSEDAGSKPKQFLASIQNLSNLKRWKYYILDEKLINKFRDYFKNKPETVLSESYIEETTNTLSTSQIKAILKKISDKVKSDSKPPTGNQNCMLCTWCLEAQLRGYNILPRPVYSPRDIIFKQVPYNIVKNPEKLKIRNKNDVTKQILGTGNGSRYYVHVNWKGGSGGHEFIIMNINNKVYVLDAQQNEMSDINISVNGLSYFNDINYANSYIIRLDDKELNKDILKYNDNKYIIEWDDVKDPEYMKSDEYLNESKNKSTLDDNFKKKKIDFKYYKLDINDSDAKKYLETNSLCKKYLNYISKNSGEILVDKDNDKLIGYIWVGKSKDRGLITGLDILNNYKGYGLSEILLKDAINDYGAIHLTVDPDNMIAIHLYEKFGFVIVNYYNDYSGEYYYMKLESKLNKKEKEDAEKFKLQNVSEASNNDYKFLDIKSNKSKALEYLKANSETKSYAEDTIKNYNGELVIYNDIMIGRILVGDKKDKGFITDFSIDEEHRGNRLGSKLIDDAINKYHGVDLLVDKDNELALNMYKRRGFVIVKTYKNQYYMKLESKLKEDTIMMNEAMNALMTGYIPGSVDNPNNVYIVNYMQNNVFSGEDPNEGIGVSDNPKLTNLIIRDSNGILKRVDESFLNDKTYKVYIIELSKEEVSNRLSKYMGESVEEGFIYETLTGHKLYTKDQIQFESCLHPIISYNEYMKAFEEICNNYFQAKDKTSVELSKNFIPKEVRFTNNSGLMSSKKVYNLNEYINAKSDTNILECLDISIK